jgi:hypothetical protein
VQVPHHKEQIMLIPVEPTESYDVEPGRYRATCTEVREIQKQTHRGTEKRLRISVVCPTVEKKKVLIVEDHLLFCAMLAQLINQEPGMTVCGQADSIEVALRLIEQTLPDAAIGT